MKYKTVLFYDQEIEAGVEFEKGCEGDGGITKPVKDSFTLTGNYKTKSGVDISEEITKLNKALDNVIEDDFSYQINL